jgi:hypothetical protein
LSHLDAPGISHPAGSHLSKSDIYTASFKMTHLENMHFRVHMHLGAFRIGAPKRKLPGRLKSFHKAQFL